MGVFPQCFADFPADHGNLVTPPLLAKSIMKVLPPTHSGKGCTLVRPAYHF